MDWPIWLTEARIAIIISLASATFTGLGLIYTRRLAKNDTARMKRKSPVLELVPEGTPSHGGWQSFSLTIRNFETVSAYIEAVATKRHGACIMLQRTSPIMFADDPYPDQDPSKRPEASNDTIIIQRAIGPQSRHKDYTSWIYAKGISKPSDLRISWQWADGQKR